MIIFWCWLSTLCPAKAWVLLQYRRSFNYNGSLFWYQWALRKSNGHNNSSGYHGHWKNSWSCFQIDRKNFTHVNEDFVLEDSTSALMLHIWDPLIANIQTGPFSARHQTQLCHQQFWHFLTITTWNINVIFPSVTQHLRLFGLFTWI